MKVFLSWSGEPSRQVANALYKWLPHVLQAVKPWMSQQDIHSGAVWTPELLASLGEAKAGIACVTPDNTKAPFLLFEAGAIAKSVGQPLRDPLI